MTAIRSFIIIFLSVVNLHATVYYVDASRPNDSGSGMSWATAKRTIQGAVDVSVDRDSIVVTNGIYAPINVWNGTRTIRSVSGASTTIIDGGHANRCATLGTVESDTKTILIGFTLRNGYLNNIRKAGAGAFAGTLSQCIISNNSARCDNTTITNPGGGGTYGSVLDSCILIHNTSGGAYAYGGGAANSVLRNCLVTHNFASRSAGGTWSSEQYNCTIVNNTVGTSGFGAGVCHGILFNCIVVSNTWTDGTLANFYYIDGGTSLYNCTTPKLDGTGNISVNPAFINISKNDYRLRTDSQCINAGTNSNDTGTADLDGNPRILDGTVDMGSYEGGFKVSQVITFASLPPKTYGDAAFAPSATSSSGLAVEYASGNQTVATISNALINIVGVGTTTIIASQPGDSIFEAAPPVTNSLSVGLPTVTISPADGTTFTNSLNVTLANAPPTAAIHYTLDGTEPTETSALYTNTVNLALSCTLKARSFAGGIAPSPITTATYTGFYTVTVTDGTIDGVSSGVYGTGVSLDLLAATTPVGHHFDRWHVTPSNADLGTLFCSTQQETKILVPPIPLSLQALFQDNVYSVTFDPYGGEVEPADKAVTFDGLYGELPEPLRTGYAFQGWRAATNGVTFAVTAESVVAVAEDHTLTAAWTANEYTVTFDAQGGDVEPADKLVMYDGVYGELPAPERTGYTFAGWQAETNGVVFDVTAESVVAVAEDHTLTAAWTANEYTVTFDAQGGEVEPADKLVMYDGVYGVLPVPVLTIESRFGYRFGGWWSGMYGKGIQVTPETVVKVSNDHNLYADWERISVNLVLPANGGVLESYRSQYNTTTYKAANLTDESTESVWRSAIRPRNEQAFEYSFFEGKAAVLNGVTLFNVSGTFASKGFEVWVLPPGGQWQKFAEGNLLKTAAAQEFDLGGVVAERARLVIVSGYSSLYWELAEFEIHGYLSAPTRLADLWYAERGFEPEPGGTWEFMDNRLAPGKNTTLWQEYVADTDPNDPTSVFRVTGVEPGPPVRVGFDPASLWRVYRLQYTDDLSSGVWHDVGERPRPGEGVGDALTDVQAQPAAGRRFYRVQVNLPE